MSIHALYNVVLNKRNAEIRNRNRGRRNTKKRAFNQINYKYCDANKSE